MHKQDRELTGVFGRLIAHYPDGDTLYALLRTGERIVGKADPEQFTRGMSYRFLGRWTDHWKYGRQFNFDTYVQAVPASEESIVKYLQRNANHVGPAKARRLCERYGADAVRVLRESPEEVAGRGILTLDQAHEAAACLRQLEARESTLIELHGLFAGRGFPLNRLIDACMQLFGAAAGERVKRDPYCLLVHRLPGCGFCRVDRLYLDLGGRPDRLKRQMLCAWHAVRTDRRGNTWVEVEVAERGVRDLVAGCQVRTERAIRLGVRAGWLALRVDERGRRWLAERIKADNERRLARKVGELQGAEHENQMAKRATPGRLDRTPA
jgi:hypothetical protein